MTESFDRIIIGAGLYGLYSALFSCRKGQRVIVLECERDAFKRATTINQARVHQGYHYPRSIATAMKSAGYFERFNRDYAFCINSRFDQIYATSSRYSWTNGEQFIKFCRAAGIPCKEIPAEDHFRPGMVDGVFLTREYTYDAQILKGYFLEELAKYPGRVCLRFGAEITAIERDDDAYTVRLKDGSVFRSGFVLNASYAGTNQILEMAGFEKLRIKYELCEIILCDVSEPLRGTGITVMDGPFFSVMPFGKTGLHSLTSVTFTPHKASYEMLPVFPCQEKSGKTCSPARLGNCNECPGKPASAFPYMSNLAHKYMRDDHRCIWRESLFSMKPILLSSEIDDSRPTIIRTYSRKPSFVSVFSGKINTVYDLDEVLNDE